MKISSVILLLTFALSITAMFASNFLLKDEFDKLDKNDTYWTYGKVLEQPFKHLKIEGGNISHISFEPSATPSVRVFKNWAGYVNKTVKTSVKNDTLYIHFPNDIKNPNEKKYLQWNTMVRIFSPQLLSVTGHDTNIELNKMRQKNFHIRLSGKSKLEVSSYLHTMDSIEVNQQDSTEVVFAISRDLQGKAEVQQPAKIEGSPSVRTQPGRLKGLERMPGAEVPPTSWETMFVKTVNANVQGASLLNLGHAQINTIRLNISDTSAIILSGGSLRKFKQ